MKRKCPHCTSTNPSHSKFGSFVRASDGRKLNRFRCRHCRRTFSEATFQLCYRQKKRRLNPRIREMLASCVSQRRIALLLKTNRKTVVRKFLFLAQVAREKNQRDFENLESISAFQFDDLETIEHTKCKPLSVTMAVEPTERIIFGAVVARMPAKGPLAKISRKKYGPRIDERSRQRNALFEVLAKKTIPEVLIESDENPHYPQDVKRWFPQCDHQTVKGARGCVAGQGELKKLAFDPLFTLNHTFAMLRANINRLVRKTWCTTKIPGRLDDHLQLYIYYHNHYLIKQKAAA
ncbi:MAG: IS1 family transposase [Bdellovibrionales bacterium]|nr:IS1 family transposase [Bdellovibrionales bacterium]